MNSELNSFLTEYEGEDPNSISRFKKYREKSSVMNGYFLLILLTAIILHEGLSFRISELSPPISRYFFSILLIVPIISSLVLRFGLRGVDMNRARFSYHHLREAIQSYADNDYEGTARLRLN